MNKAGHCEDKDNRSGVDEPSVGREPHFIEIISSLVSIISPAVIHCPVESPVC